MTHWEYENIIFYHKSLVHSEAGSGVRRHSVLMVGMERASLVEKEESLGACGKERDLDLARDKSACGVESLQSRGLSRYSFKNSFLITLSS